MDRPFSDRNNPEAQPENFAESIDELWGRIGEIVKSKGVTEANVGQIIAEIRREQKALGG